MRCFQCLFFLVIQILFRPSFEEFDVVIILHDQWNPRRHQAVDLGRSCSYQYQPTSMSIPIVNFDPIQCYMNELKVIVYAHQKFTEFRTFNHFWTFSKYLRSFLIDFVHIGKLFKCGNVFSGLLWWEKDWSGLETRPTSRKTIQGFTQFIITSFSNNIYKFSICFRCLVATFICQQRGKQSKPQ